MKRTLIAMVAALGLASSASAATLSLDTDAATYNVSDTITVTMVLDVTQGDLAASVFTEITWDGAIATSAANSSQDVLLQAFGGFIVGVPGTGTCLDVNGQCAMHDQILGLSPVPVDANIVTATLTMHADALGLLGLGIGAVNAFGLTAGDVTFGANASVAEVVPEPGTAAMVGLGLLGLASVGRRRA